MTLGRCCLPSYHLLLPCVCSRSLHSPPAAEFHCRPRPALPRRSDHLLPPPRHPALPNRLRRSLPPPAPPTRGPHHPPAAPSPPASPPTTHNHRRTCRRHRASL
uniref:Uncharacterized protein n=1 Tax=Setaria viridis TaxID=4556 RepID=A0A4U6U5K7_SETVI|nr:hypothetical protein SEVIR_6G119225v2 [Setaria viridis]